MKTYFQNCLGSMQAKQILMIAKLVDYLYFSCVQNASFSQILSADDPDFCCIEQIEAIKRYPPQTLPTSICTPASTCTHTLYTLPAPIDELSKLLSKSRFSLYAPGPIPLPIPGYCFSSSPLSLFTIVSSLHWIIPIKYTDRLIFPHILNNRQKKIYLDPLSLLATTHFPQPLYV